MFIGNSASLRNLDFTFVKSLQVKCLDHEKILAELQPTFGDPILYVYRHLDTGKIVQTETEQDYRKYYLVGWTFYEDLITIDAYWDTSIYRSKEYQERSKRLATLDNIAEHLINSLPGDWRRVLAEDTTFPWTHRLEIQRTDNLALTGWEVKGDKFQWSYRLPHYPQHEFEHSRLKVGATITRPLHIIGNIIATKVLPEAESHLEAYNAHCQKYADNSDTMHNIADRLLTRYGKDQLRWSSLDDRNQSRYDKDIVLEFGSYLQPGRATVRVNHYQALYHKPPVTLTLEQLTPEIAETLLLTLKQLSA